MLHLLSLLAMHTVGIMLPGPAFALTLNHSLMHSRRAALLTALGLGLGMFVLASSSAFLLPVVLQSAESLVLIMRYAGAAYLLYLAWGAWTAGAQLAPQLAGVSGHLHLPMGDQAAVVSGLLCNSLNPKLLAYFIVIFSSCADELSLLDRSVGVAYMTVVTTAWFGFLALLMTGSQVKGRLVQIQGFQRYVTKGSAYLFGAFALLVLFL